MMHTVDRPLLDFIGDAALGTLAIIFVATAIRWVSDRLASRSDINGGCDD